MVAFFDTIVHFLDETNIPYMLTGSMAMSVYLVGRSTHDFDFIVQLKKEDVPKVVAQFKKGYYCDEDAINDAIERRSMFNIIDHNSMFKADFFVFKDNDVYQQTAFTRRTSVELLGLKMDVISVEDLIVSKILWIQQLESGRQKEDISVLLKTDGIDMNYIRHWIYQLKLNTFDLTI